MQLLCGTSGFSFREWKGPFYPEKLPANEMLAFYGARLPTVEINNTFYRMPKESVLQGWSAQVPETFRFAIKAPRRISHVKRLRDCAQEAGFFFGALAALGAHLGAVLVQLPPHARVDVATLEAFLQLVPDALPVAFEFRHASWSDASVYTVLENYGAAWVTSDTTGGAPPTLPATATWTYLRLRAPAYEAETLRAWKQRCEPFERAFVFFKHEDDALGPALAARMLQL